MKMTEIEKLKKQISILRSTNNKYKDRLLHYWGHTRWEIERWVEKTEDTKKRQLKKLKSL